MKTALITAIGSFSADAVIKSLKTHGLKIIGCDIFPKEWIVDAYSVDRFFQIPRGTFGDIYIEALKKICLQENVDYLIPLTDAEIDTLNENRAWFQEHGIQLCISSKETIDVCRDKYRTFQCLSKMNLSVHIIPTISASEYSESFFPDKPLVFKPANGRSSQGLRRVFNRRELAVIMDETDPLKYIVQPLIEGSVVTVDVIRSPYSGKIVCIPRKELLRTTSGAGTSVYVFHDDMLCAECERIANCLDIRGCVNFEFIQAADGTYYFMECNPRFSGGVEFSCMTGYDLVLAHLNCFSEKDIESLGTYRNCYIARKYEETITALE